MTESVVHFMLRMPPALHERVAGLARDRKDSLNAIVVAVLRDAVARRQNMRSRSTTS